VEDPDKIDEAVTSGLAVVRRLLEGEAG
jgi:hypothetical protein